jgi:hypothetical protein
MTMKKGARSVHKGIFEHRKRTSPVYAEVAAAPEFVQEAFLAKFSNVLTRKYAAARIQDAQMDVALARIDQLDPYPYVHEHEDCPYSGIRSGTPEGDHARFKPRDGFITDRGAYDV